MVNGVEPERRNTKGVSISIRMMGQDADTLDEVCERTNLNRSELIRKAASNFIKLHAIDNPVYPNPKLFLSHNLLRILMDEADKPTLKKMAAQSFENGKHDYTYIKRLTNNTANIKNGAPLPEDAVRSLIYNVFSEDGQNWFKKVHYEYKDSKIIVTGRHDMGKNFSAFVKYLLAHYMNEIDYKEVKSEMGDMEITENGRTQEFFSVKLVYKKAPQKIQK